MNRILLPVAILATLCGTASCGNAKSNDIASTTENVAEASDSVPYTVVNNYFINNNNDTVPDVIATEVEFQKCFGMATHMGDGGQPTAVDFSKYFIIVASVPPTDISTDITPVSLTEDGDSLLFTCKITEGEKQSYTIHPFTMIAVSKRYPLSVKICMLRDR